MVGALGEVSTNFVLCEHKWQIERNHCKMQLEQMQETNL